MLTLTEAEHEALQMLVHRGPTTLGLGMSDIRLSAGLRLAIGGLAQVTLRAGTIKSRPRRWAGPLPSGARHERPAKGEIPNISISF